MLMALPSARAFSVKPNTLIPHPGGGYSFGTIPSDLPHNLPGGDIYLKYGMHRGPQNGYGVAHIWAAHGPDLEKLGYASFSDVAVYVSQIVRPGTPIYREFASMRATRLAILRSALGLLIAEYRPLPQAPLRYSVITAYPRRQAHGKLVGQIEKAP